MDDKESILKKVEDGIKRGTKSVEDFADEVAAPQAPVIIIPDPDAPAPKPPAGNRDG